MEVKRITDIIEQLAPLGFQDEWDNCGLQVGNPSKDVTKVLVCLDVTEEIVDEAIAKGCGLVVSHHPLIFRGLKHVTGETYQERCVIKAILNDLCIYSAHTSLDNAPGGVNYRIAEKIGLKNLEWLDPKPGVNAGSGVCGELPSAEDADAFLARLKEAFGVDCLLHSDACGKKISKVALCGGAGAFLMPSAAAKGADCFITGELHYHDYFDPGLMLVEMGHYESEQFTVDLLCEHIRGHFPELQVLKTEILTNPIRYKA